jgi:hypothetical protein
MQFILLRSQRLPGLTHCVTNAREDTADRKAPKAIRTSVTNAREDSATRDEDAVLLGRRGPGAG